MVEQGDIFDAELEQELRTGLRPLPAPTGFSERTLQRRQLAAESGPDFRNAKSLRRRSPQKFPARPPWLRWGAAACLVVTVLLGGILQHQRERREAGARARQQVLLALRITRLTLQAVQNRVDNDRAN